MFPFPFSFIVGVPDIPVEQIANAQAMSFNGTDQYVDGSVVSQIGSSSSFTINLWSKSNTSTGFFSLFGIRQSTTDRILIFNSSNTNKLQFAIQNGINDYIVTSHSLSTTQWEMITLTYNGSLSAGSRASVYINGSPISITQPNLPTSVSANMGTKPIYIGFQQDSGSGYYGGELDEVAIFNTALLGPKIQQIYDATAVVGGVPQTANLFTGGLDTSLVYWNRMGDS